MFINPFTFIMAENTKAVFRIILSTSWLVGKPAFFRFRRTRKLQRYFPLNIFSDVPHSFWGAPPISNRKTPPLTKLL